MSKPNFHAMSQKELHDYVLAHREDQEAFYAYVDKLHVEGNWIEMPPFIERVRSSSEPQDGAV
ncbi:hypothetical protein A4S05_17450 [Nostoc sp. KVJ20]|uniref:DUF6887 family protein n=1 Tax=Nostoc sp. KVJ20 TaxID=457944 RepID=UPI00083CCC80|nr:hypothetical protein [Nostoc sp. KVJ20]ODG96647.1 hypothetical protein A4S05_17450 [Nostoc sp. KVJ20]